MLFLESYDSRSTYVYQQVQKSNVKLHLPRFYIVAKDIYELIRISDNDLCNFLKMDSRVENKTFDSILNLNKMIFFKLLHQN